MEKEAGNGRESFPSINGLNTAKGIALTGGTADRYRKVLSMFHRDVEARLQMFRYFIFECMNSKDNKLPEKHLPLFITQVHAIKSASGTIGATEISSDAAILENAGFAKDLTLIQFKLPGFIEHLEDLVKNIRVAIEYKPEQDQEPDVFEHLPILHELAEALKIQNVTDIDRMLEEFYAKPLDPKLKEIAEYLSDQISMAEFDDALRTIDKLINKK